MLTTNPKPLRLQPQRTWDDKPSLTLVEKPPELQKQPAERFELLDGWRGISILCVLATHMLPLGPKEWQMNASTGNFGMALFFTLSGFLIAKTLQRNSDPIAFFIRRLFRIVPLAFLFLAVVLPFLDLSPLANLAHFTFLANTGSSFFDPVTLHFWSLCIEVQFYVFIGLLAAFFGKKGLLSLPFFLLASTAAIILLNEHGTMKTYLRIDEILAGSVLALIHSHEKAEGIRRFLAKTPFLLLLGLLALTSHMAFIEYDWLRAYAAMALIGHTLFREPSKYMNVLRSRALVYVAEISFALYVIHPATITGWLGSGNGLEKYIKRPISFALTFGLAHLSTFHFENRFIAFGKKLVDKRKKRKE